MLCTEPDMLFLSNYLLTLIFPVIVIKLNMYYHLKKHYFYIITLKARDDLNNLIKWLSEEKKNSYKILLTLNTGTKMLLFGTSVMFQMNLATLPRKPPK